MDWRTLPPLSALRAFAALAETGSFTKAGQALNVSHAAVSQQVRALEERLGLQLVDRDGRRIALTPDGERLAAALAGAFASIARAVDELTGGDAQRPLLVTTTPAFATSWLMPRLADLRHQHPEVELMLNPTHELVELAPGGVDVAIRYGSGGWRGVDSELLLPTTFVLVGTPSLIGDRTITDYRDILDLPWIQEFGTTEMSSWLSEHGVAATRRGNIVHLPGHLVLEAVRNGQGVSLATRVNVERDLREGRLVAIFEEDLPGRGYHVVTRPGVQRPPLRAFVRWLRRQVKPPAR